MECSVGVCCKEDCNKDTYGKVNDKLNTFSDLSEENQEILKRRLCVTNLTTVCEYHYKKYVHKYFHLFGQRCCDPFQCHKKVITKGLKEISLKVARLHSRPDFQLVPGMGLCITCFKKISENYSTEPVDETYASVEETGGAVKTACEALGVSPVKIKKLSHEKRHQAIEKKVTTVTSVFREKLSTSLSLPCEEKDIGNPSEEAEYDILLCKLKDRFKESNEVADKVKILSLVPQSWSILKTCEEFGASQYLVKNTRKLVKKYGILPGIEKKKSRKLSHGTVEMITHFYENDNHSRICPGKKDFVSHRKENGEKEQKQKRLILCNLKELYQYFRTEHPDVKIGFSKFAELRPKWCILAGASGTHSVCVCVAHQNVKLMIDGAKLNIDYKDILESMVCDMKSESCMFDECAQCSGSQIVHDLMELEFGDEVDTFEDNITYKQWVATDRADLITITKSREEFTEDLICKLVSLKKHHFVSKTQSNYLKDLKRNLESMECIVIGDFSENFTFIVQDEIQSFHWVNEQATLHPFVIYYRDPSENIVVSKSYCFISDYMYHNTLAVYAFQKRLVSEISASLPFIKKIIYFSDGASGQYKNKKNFINLCYHNYDFHIEAEWNFFATSHGKGPCDGIGGTVKRLVSKASLQRVTSGHILDPETMFNFCKSNITGIVFFYLKQNDIIIATSHLHDRFENAQQVPKTREKHRFVPLDTQRIRCYITSTSNDFQDATLAILPTDIVPVIKEKDYVACVYESRWWLGEVTQVHKDEEDCTVHFFHPAGPTTSFYKSVNDHACVPFTNILKVVSVSEFGTSTGRVRNLDSKSSIELTQLLENKLKKRK